MERQEERDEIWTPDLTYVIGHQRPDTDAIASALGYAWYRSSSGEEGVVAARAGQPGPQALFALERFGMPPPCLLADVAPVFRHVARQDVPIRPEAPLAEALARLAQGERVAPVVDGEGRPLGVVTPMALARAYSGPDGGPAAMARPCRELLEAAPALAARERIRDHRPLLVRGEADDFLVVDDAGRYLGMATRARVLQPPRARLVLVDHNELAQAVPGAEEAEIVGVLDHHRLGNAATPAPIPFVVDPVGSTCTLVAEQCRMRGLEPPANLAGVMLSGILSDTLLFRSPTTTERDRAAAEWLAGRVPLDLIPYGEELLRAAPGLASRDAGEIVDADRKSYRMAEQDVSVGQVEVTAMHELPQRRAELLTALRAQREREGLALACLMVTDVVAGRSRLLGEGEPRILAALPFPRLGEREFDLGTMVSRKKQLVPALQAALELGTS